MLVATNHPYTATAVLSFHCGRIFPLRSVWIYIALLIEKQNNCNSNKVVLISGNSPLNINSSILNVIHFPGLGKGNGSQRNPRSRIIMRSRESESHDLWISIISGDFLFPQWDLFKPWQKKSVLNIKVNRLTYGHTERLPSLLQWQRYIEGKKRRQRTVPVLCCSIGLSGPPFFNYDFRRMRTVPCWVFLISLKQLKDKSWVYKMARAHIECLMHAYVYHPN